MAVNKALRAGHGDGMVRSITQANFDDIITQANDPSQQVDPTAMKRVGGSGRVEFRKECNHNFTLIRAGVDDPATASQGTLTVDTQVTADDTVTIGTAVYTFKASTTTDGEIEIGTDLAATQANIVAAINGTDGYSTHHQDVIAGAFASDDCIITALVGGVAGDLIATTETFDEATNVFDAATLGTTTAGDDGDPMDTLEVLGGGESWRIIKSKLNTNFTILDDYID